jgi:phosphotriesterase-related protein
LLVSTVETVRGPVDVTKLGRALMHEQVFILQPEALQNYGHVWGDSYWDEEARVAEAIGKLRALREAGIETFVDPTAPGLGRFIPRLQRINADVDLNFIVATGSTRSWSSRTSSTNAAAGTDPPALARRG